VFIGSGKIITELRLIPEIRPTPFPGSGREFSLLSFSCFVVLDAWEMVVFICVPEPAKKCTCLVMPLGVILDPPGNPAE